MNRAKLLNQKSREGEVSLSLTGRKPAFAKRFSHQEWGQFLEEREALKPTKESSQSVIKA